MSAINATSGWKYASEDASTAMSVAPMAAIPAARPSSPSKNFMAYVTVSNHTMAIKSPGKEICNDPTENDDHASDSTPGPVGFVISVTPVPLPTTMSDAASGNKN